ncbi:MAG: hypothetical protein BAJALOKI1v1_2310006 [Promethearchaeota archaeon]|nr:MAG: hypothetical protein BAJALOKI1v1_2310006 [Candidatus Lokiarchaeota archaeon]
MSESATFILACTLHDPHKRLKSMLKKVISNVVQLFSKKIICYTPSTHKEIINLLESNGFYVYKSPSMKQIDTYKEVLKNSIKSITDAKQEKIFYSDFDRLLHWVKFHPNELKNLFINYQAKDYYHIGRTPRAFHSHPPTQTSTEGIVNKIASKLLGFSEIKDIISVCYIITQNLAEKILKVSHTTKTGFYGSWPVLFWKWAQSTYYIEVEGLEWETQDQFKQEIDAKGYENWLETFQSHEEWIKRVNLLDDCLTELAQFSECRIKDASPSY